jgi:hypothetical protein
MRVWNAVIFSTLLCLTSIVPAAAAEPPVLGDLSKVGRVDFPTSCKAEVQPEFLSTSLVLSHRSPPSRTVGTQG